MNKLLKLYTLDYLKKSVLAIVGAFAFGFIVLLPFTDSFDDRLMFVNWSCYLALYALFTYIYPLPNIVKWSMNLPVSKQDIIIFNFILQVIKLVISFVILVLIFYFEIKFFPDASWIEKWGSIATEAQVMTQEGQSSFFRTTVGSPEVMLIMLSMTFSFTFFFNVSPYEMFKGKNRATEQWQGYLNYFWKFHRKTMTIIASVALALFVTRSIYYSKAFLGALTISAAFFMVFYTYYRTLVLQKKTLYTTIAVCSVLMVGIWIKFMQMSTSISSQKEIALESKLKEFEFQGKHLDEMSHDEIVQMISDSNLCPRDLKKLLSLRYPKLVISKGWKISAFPQFKHKLEGLDFSKIVLSKEKSCSLRSSLALFDIEKVSAAHAIAFSEKWLSVEHENKHRPKLVDKMAKVKFDQQDIETLFNKKEIAFHQMALKSLIKNKKTIDPQIIFKYAANFDNYSLGLASQYLKSQSCRNLGYKEILDKKSYNMVDFKPETCHRRTKTRELSSLESGPYIRRSK